ncbi:MAG TPA: helicase-related protein, partial [Nitrososphaeraceae archaeon]|nr:helicase-related protein [Nitrososphaeraceae archaeon]
MASSPAYVRHPLIWDNTIEYRLYQKNIANSAARSNTLVILPTALGKTVISILVCAEALYNHSDKRVLVMAPTRPLVAQHLRLFSSVLKILEQVVSVTGKTPPEMRRAVWDKAEVRLIFATPEVVKNDLNEGRLLLRDFSLLVFDEAHKAVKDYSYALIAKEYVNQYRHPMILGLTASPGAERSRVQEVCNNLFIENLEYRNEEDSDVKPYINPIEVSWMWLTLSQQYLYIISKLRSMLYEKLKWLIRNGMLRKKSLEWVFKRDLLSLGDELRYTIELTMEEQRSKLYSALKKQSSALTLMYCLELIESQGSFSLRAFLDRMEQEERGKTYTSILKHPDIMEIRTLLENMTDESPKIQYLLQLVKQNTDRPQIGERYEEITGTNNNKYYNQKSRILVFTQYRETAKHIVDVLSRNKISCSRFVGQSSRLGDDGMTQDKQAEVLEFFKGGDYQVLVATSIAEEGLDIPEVDLVVFYEPIPSEIRYIQRRGRTGRKSSGLVIILAMKDSIDARYLNASTRRVQKMKELLAYIKTTFKPLARDEQLRPNPMTQEELTVIERRNKRLEDRLSGTIKLAIAQGTLSEDQAKERLSTLIRNRKVNSLSIEADMLTGKLKRDVDRAARRIYIELQKYGSNGIEIETLGEILDIDYSVIINAIKKLEKLRKVEWKNEGIVASTYWGFRQTIGKTLNLIVEKIIRGKALVVVDDKWHARLNHYDYEGPREFLKKGIRLKAIGELYHQDGILCIKVKQIIGVS